MAAVVMKSPTKGFDEMMTSFNMNELRTNLPQKRGLSRYYSGKSQSFTCLSDVQSIEDLKKQQAPDQAKKRKKYPGGASAASMVPRFPCRRVASSNHCAQLVIGI
ncbi:uncharacterized protein LOC113288703 isoform X2 [Papaver somniferum]|uniref:uncharacterized protein LOC113288703 isoform X2 n=1 Tax=Papaver somniferum TaxID=3469 RepID=UPI000E703809|nr:uncharacterized protein LOC113288703 isoform X2 [Papaver somniferum]